LNLAELFAAENFPLKKVAGTNGGEWAGPCPWCGGKDRFRVWPTPRDAKGRYWCRGCDRSGDEIQFLRDFKNLSFAEACRQLGMTPKAPAGNQAPRPAGWTPAETTRPPAQWSKQAEMILTETEAALWSDLGGFARGWLDKVRGLSEKTIRRARLGWNRSDRFFARATWGLAPKKNAETGKSKKVWIPAGLVIPFEKDGTVIRLRVRRPNPKTGGRYIAVTGSAMPPMLLGAERGLPAVVVESELDGLLVYQAAGGRAAVIALGFAQGRPDKEAHAILKAAPRILVALDYDRAGKESWLKFWRKYYRQAIRWPVPAGKDPVEAFQGGVDLAEWIRTGLDVDPGDFRTG